MAYQTLEKLFHMDGSSARFGNAEKRLRERLEADSTYRMGIETPHGELFLAIPRELSQLGEDVLLHERKLSERVHALPTVARGAMLRGLVIDEVVSTNDLEGVYSTRRQINELLQVGGGGEPQPGQRRFRELATMYLGLTGGDPVPPASLGDIRAVYDRVMSGEPLDSFERPDGKLFRKDEVVVVGHGSRVVHEGLHPESRIAEVLESMLQLVSSPGLPSLYGALISHFLFEYAHPFYDGNGRTGRYLLALYLSRSLSVMTSLSLSRVIAENRGQYYRAFRDAESPLNHGELTFFVLTMLGYVSQAQDELDTSLMQKQERLAGLGAALERMGAAHGLEGADAEMVSLMAQLELFAAFPEVSQGDLAQHVGLSWQQARVHTKALAEKGIVEVATRRPLRLRLTEGALGELGLR